MIGVVCDVYRLLKGFIWGSELILRLRYKFGVIWSVLGSGKRRGKTQNSGLAKERRGARFLLRENGPLTRWAPRRIRAAPRLKANFRT